MRLASTTVFVMNQDNWSCGSLERRRKLYWLHRRLSEPQERLSHLLCQKAYRLLYEKSPKSPESESMLKTLGLIAPDERSYSNFSWSNSTTSDLTDYPRSLRSACATVFSLVEKTDPQRSHHFLFGGENWTIEE